MKNNIPIECHVLKFLASLNDAYKMDVMIESLKLCENTRAV